MSGCRPSRAWFFESADAEWEPEFPCVFRIHEVVPSVYGEYTKGFAWFDRVLDERAVRRLGGRRVDWLDAGPMFGQSFVSVVRAFAGSNGESAGGAPVVSSESLELAARVDQAVAAGPGERGALLRALERDLSPGGALCFPPLGGLATLSGPRSRDAVFDESRPSVRRRGP